MRGGRPTHVKLHGAGELAPDASLLPRVCTLQWSPGSLPGYTGSFLPCTKVIWCTSMEPGITPGMQRRQLPRICTRCTSFNGAWDYSQDATPIWLTGNKSFYVLQWSLGLLPGYTAAPGLLSGRRGPSMEPGIIPGIHWTTSTRASGEGILQWSPGSLPGYTAARGLRGPDWQASMEPGITPGIHCYQFLPRSDAGCKAHFRQPLPKASLAPPIRGAPTKKSFYSKQLFLRRLYGIFTPDPGCRGH